MASSYKVGDKVAILAGDCSVDNHPDRVIAHGTIVCDHRGNCQFDGDWEIDSPEVGYLTTRHECDLILLKEPTDA